MKKTLFLLLAALMLSAAPVLADGLKVITEDLPPYNYQKDGRVSGISTDIFLRMAERAGLDIKRRDILVWPWARGYKEIQGKSNVILYSTLRTREREDMFQWIGPIDHLKSLLIARKGSGIQITDFDKDIRGLRVGTVRDNASEQFIIGHGADPDRLQRVHDLRLNIMKLMDGRIDVTAVLERVLLKTLKNMGRSIDDFDVVRTLMSGDLYFAASRNMDPSVTARLQKALDELKAEGEVEAIIDSYH